MDKWKYSKGIRNGVITGCNITLEWMLPWWWFHYSLHNSYPVTFLDFGMTSNGQRWCREHGELIPVSGLNLATKQQIHPNLIKLWEGRWGEGVWNLRPIWFQKPLGLMHTPFRRSLWIDLDCEICGSLESLFPMCENDGGIAILEELEFTQNYLVQIGAQQAGEKNYNSGVIVYRHGSPLISFWAEKAMQENHLFMGDQDALSRVIFEKKLPFNFLSPLANWLAYVWGIYYEPPKDILIHHFAGGQGKIAILEKMTEIQKNTFFSFSLD